MHTDRNVSSSNHFSLLAYRIQKNFQERMNSTGTANMVQSVLELTAQFSVFGAHSAKPDTYQLRGISFRVSLEVIEDLESFP